MVAPRWDETQKRLADWTDSSGKSERLAAQILYSADFEAVDPSHPLGGRDGGRDARATRNGMEWAMAVYFPRGQKAFAVTKRKFSSDAAGLSAGEGIAFVTNQEVTVAQRAELENSQDRPVEIFHLERIGAMLDRPAMARVRFQFLGIGAGPDKQELLSRPASGVDVVKAAPKPPGAPGHATFANDVIALRVAAVPASNRVRHPATTDPSALLTTASRDAVSICASWPERAGLLAKELRRGWTYAESHVWGAGWLRCGQSSLLLPEAAASAAFRPRDSAVSVWRTWNARSTNDRGRPSSYFVARDTEIAAELLVSIRLIGGLLEAIEPGPVDIGLHLAFATGSEWLVSSESAIPGGGLGEPAGYLSRPPTKVPGDSYDDTLRVESSELANSSALARELLAPWFSGFSDRSAFDRIPGQAPDGSGG